jgi:hypothetical protein
VRSAHLTSPRPRRRAFALVTGLLLAAGALSACSDDGPPTPAISGENPAEVTVPTVPPTTADPATADSTTTTEAGGGSGGGGESATTTTGG